MTQQATCADFVLCSSLKLFSKRQQNNPTLSSSPPRAFLSLRLTRLTVGVRQRLATAPTKRVRYWHYSGEMQIKGTASPTGRDASACLPSSLPSQPLVKTDQCSTSHVSRQQPHSSLPLVAIATANFRTVPKHQPKYS